jgi:hypothetical protein
LASLVSAPAPDDGRADLEAWLAVKYRIPTEAQRRFLDVYVGVFDVTGPERSARLIFSHPDDPIKALKDDLAAFRAERIAEAKVAEVPKPQPHRKASKLTGINAEIAKVLNAQYAEEAKE